MVYSVLCTFTATIDVSLKTKEPETKENKKPFAAEDYVEAEDILLESQRIAVRVNRHRHSASCFPPGAKYCRYQMPRAEVEGTFETEITAEPEIGGPVRKCPNSAP